jgi:hypothetical protein
LFCEKVLKNTMQKKVTLKMIKACKKMHLGDFSDPSSS